MRKISFYRLHIGKCSIEESFKLGILLKQARIDAGMTKEQITNEPNTTKSVISRMENHAIDI